MAIQPTSHAFIHTVTRRPTMHRRTILMGAVAVLGAVAWYALRPERLFLDRTVNESFAAEPAGGDGASASAPVALAAGSFHTNAHETKGRATVHEIGGKRVLRLTEFSTSDGPDVHVYLVAAPDVNDDDTVKRAGFVDLGPLKGNRGDQNYELPAGLDLARYRTATIWCARFSVNFGSAPLTAS